MTDTIRKFRLLPKKLRQRVYIEFDLSMDRDQLAAWTGGFMSLAEIRLLGNIEDNFVRPALREAVRQLRARQ